MSQISLPWQPGSFVVKFDWHHSIARPQKPHVSRKHLRDISYKPSYSWFCLKFHCHGNGLVVVEFVWHYSIAQPRVPPTRRKRHCDIFYMSGVIACFVSIFVAMATRVVLCKIWLTSFDSPTTKTPDIRRDLGDILSQISLPWQQGLVVVEFVWHHSIARQRKPPIYAEISGISLTEAEL